MAEGWKYFFEYRGKRLELSEGSRILGRSRTCDLPVQEPSVSRQHASLALDNGQVFVEDLGSSNGTYLNGKKFQGRQQLRSGDLLGLGDADLRLLIEEPAVPSVATVKMEAIGRQEPGEATFFLQSASMEIAQQAISSEDGGFVPVPVEESPSPEATAPMPTVKPSSTPVVEPEASFADLLESGAVAAPVIEPAIEPLPEEAPSLPAPPTRSTDAAAPTASPPPLVTASPEEIPEPSRARLSALTAAAAETLAATDLAGDDRRFSIALTPPPPLAEPILPTSPAPSVDEPELIAAHSPSPEPRQEAGGGVRRASSEILPSLEDLEAAIGLPELALPTPTAVESSATESRLSRAGFLPRMLAALADLLWILGLGLSASFAWGGPSTAQGAQFFVLLSTAAAVLASLVGWTLWGTTPGKRVFGLYVSSAEGQIGLGLAMAMKRLLGYVPSAVLLGGGFLMILGAERRGLHDRLAGTLVVHR